MRGWRRWLLGVGLMAASAFGLLVWKPELTLEAEFARQRWLAGATSHDVSVSGHRWRYLEVGSGPVVVLVHGFTGSKENWLPIMGALATHYRVLAPDLPGWGESERRADKTYGFTEQTAHLDAFVAAVAGEGDVRVVGHSMGGGIAALWASAQPEALRQLVLMDAAGVPFDNDFARRVRAGEHPFEVLDEATLQRQIALVFDRPPFAPWPATTALARMRAAQVAFEREVLRTIAGDESLAFAPGEAASRIAVPTLLAWCRNDRVIDASAAAVYAERIADTQTVWFDDCSHMPMMEQPAATAAALIAFFAEG